ncbi:conserved membrane hypothetical protein [groundwater metagenome]|uniref:Tetratricopeptide repeat protein n=1 Tax=groundwater metagenome TaxID=717931 RepID=A0A098E9F4_9ZZZZ
MLKKILFWLVIIALIGTVNAEENCSSIERLTQNLTENESKNSGFVYYEAGKCYKEKKDYEKAINSYIISAEILKNISEYNYSGISYFSAGDCYKELNDLNNSLKYYLLATENFVKTENYEYVATSYLMAGECYYKQRDCNNTGKYYLLGAGYYKRYNESYDDSWVEKVVESCNDKQDKINKTTELIESDENDLTFGIPQNLIILGVVIGLIIFALKSALACGFVALQRKEIIGIASIYFISAVLMSNLIGRVSEELTETLLNYGVMFHIIIALLLIIFGLYTIRKWAYGRCDMSRKTFLVMALPCPACLTAIFMSCSFLVLLGMQSTIVGILVGSVFFVSIAAISFATRKFGFGSPTGLGSIMVFFGFFYLFSILLIPSYLQASKMGGITSPILFADGFYGYLFMIGMVSIGFLIERINLKTKILNKIKTI